MVMLTPIPSRTHVALHAVVYNPLQSDKEGENTTRPEGASKNSQEVLRGKWWYSQVQNKVGSFSWRWRCTRRANCGDRYRTHRGSFGAHVPHGLRKEWHIMEWRDKKHQQQFQNQEILDDFRCMDLPLFSILKYTERSDRFGIHEEEAPTEAARPVRPGTSNGASPPTTGASTTTTMASTGELKCLGPIRVLDRSTKPAIFHHFSLKIWNEVRGSGRIGGSYGWGMLRKVKERNGDRGYQLPSLPGFVAFAKA